MVVVVVAAVAVAKVEVLVVVVVALEAEAAQFLSVVVVDSVDVAVDNDICSVHLN